MPEKPRPISIPLNNIPDLGALAYKREAPEAPATPYDNIPITVETVPNSCLYEIFRGEAIMLLAIAKEMSDMLAQGKLPVGIPAQYVPILIQTQASLGHAKATLALAAAQMAATEIAAQGRTPIKRWYGPDGSIDTGYGREYFEARLGEQQQKG